MLKININLWQIKSYPRIIPETLRNKDSRRVKARLAVRERKRQVSNCELIAVNVIFIFIFPVCIKLLFCNELSVAELAH